jgi:ATP-binding cassette subfamily C protein CydC
MKPTIRGLLSLLAPFTSWIALAALMGVATIGSGIGLMAAAAFIIARAALHPSIADLQIAIVGVRFFGIARGLFRYLERYTSHQVTFRVLARLRVWFYAALEPLAPARLLHYQSGDLLARAVSDIESLQHFYVRAVAPPLVAIVITLGMGAILYGVDPALALTLVAFLCLAGVGVPALAHLLGRGPGQRSVERRAALNVALVDGIQGMADLLAYGQEVAQNTRVQALGRALVADQMRQARVAGLSNALESLLMNLGLWSVLILAIPLVGAGRLDGVGLAVLALATLASFEATLPLPLAAQYLASSLAAARRLGAMIGGRRPETGSRKPEAGSQKPEAGDQRPEAQVPSLRHQNAERRRKPETGDPQSAIRNPQSDGCSLTVRDLSFRYVPGEPLALDHVSFDLPPGKRLALVGPSGAGKSTVVNLLLRFWDYEEGEILLDGADLRRYRADDVRAQIGVVAQQTYLFNDSVRGNILVARPDASEEEMVQAAQRAQIHDFIQALPRGYDTGIGEQGLRLSGGQRQRLAIARALLRNAPILILDEATANLDAMLEQEVLRAIDVLMEGRTTLMITHQLAGLERMDEIVVLQAGRVVERGRHEELWQANGMYRRMGESDSL